MGVDDLVHTLMARGLVIRDVSRARHFLQRVGYYRLSGYTLLLETPGLWREKAGFNDYVRTHQFEPGSSFSQLVDLYDLDRRLRIHVMDALERIEVAFRNELSNHMSLKYDDAHWYLNQNFFDYRFTEPEQLFGSRYDDLIGKVESETKKNVPDSRNAFCNHYYLSYDEPPYPPGWMVVEQLSFGTWSKVYENLGSRQDKKAIAGEFELSPKELESWIRALVYLRNLCAHHTRLLGSHLKQRPVRSEKLPPEIGRGAFAHYAAIIHYMLRRVSPGSEWSTRLSDLLARFSSFDGPNLLGFPKGWWEADFWRA